MRTQLPRFLHLLTALHALGAVACLVMALGSAASERFRDALVVSGGSAVMVDLFGRWTWAFLLFVASVLATLAYASWRLRPWAWHLTLTVYGIGVLGSLWQVSAGITEGWLAAVVNGAVVAYAARPAVRRAYLGRLADLLNDLERDHGPIDPEILEKVRNEWPEPAATRPRRRDG